MTRTKKILARPRGIPYAALQVEAKALLRETILKLCDEVGAPEDLSNQVLDNALAIYERAGPEIALKCAKTTLEAFKSGSPEVSTMSTEGVLEAAERLGLVPPERIPQDGPMAKTLRSFAGSFPGFNKPAVSAAQEAELTRRLDELFGKYPKLKKNNEDDIEARLRFGALRLLGSAAKTMDNVVSDVEEQIKWELKEQGHRDRLKSSGEYYKFENERSPTLQAMARMSDRGRYF